MLCLGWWAIRSFVGAVARLEYFHRIDVWHCRREVMINYRGLFLPINVATLIQERSSKFMAVLKSVAVQSGQWQTL